MNDVLTPSTDTSKLRRIRAVNRTGITPAKLGDKPEVRWIKVYKLRINDDYQRGLSERGIKLIRRIVGNFNWSKFHAPVVVQITPDTGSDDDTYEVLDGQHSATAAASHGSIPEIPCVVVKADTLIEKADAFVGLNKEKVQMTPIQVFWASVSAGKEEAVETALGAQQAGASIVKRMPPYGDFSPGETVSVATLMAIAKRGGSIYVKRVLEPGVRAGLAPIGMDFIKAFDHLLLKEGPLKLQGDYEELSWKISQVIRRHEIQDLLDTAIKMKRLGGETIGYNLAELLKREIDGKENQS